MLIQNNYVNPEVTSHITFLIKKTIITKSLMCNTLNGFFRPSCEFSIDFGVSFVGFFDLKVNIGPGKDKY